MCIDYRMLNFKTLKNAYPLPRIQECIDKLGKARRVFTLDMISRYWQIRIAEQDIPKTAFNTRYGKYEFLVMSFGLMNASATFQTLMNTILRSYIDKFVLIYLDDVLVYSDSEKKHLEYLRLMFEALRQNHIYTRPKKCVFNQEHVEFCGHIVDQDITKILDSKVCAINDWPQPKNVQEVRQFYDLINYYRRFIHHFSIIAAPLSDLFKSEDNDKRKWRRPRPSPSDDAAVSCTASAGVILVAMARPSRIPPRMVRRVVRAVASTRIAAAVMPTATTLTWALLPASRITVGHQDHSAAMRMSRPSLRRPKSSQSAVDEHGDQRRSGLDGRARVAGGRQVMHPEEVQLGHRGRWWAPSAGSSSCSPG